MTRAVLLAPMMVALALACLVGLVLWRVPGTARRARTTTAAASRSWTSSSQTAQSCRCRPWRVGALPDPSGRVAAVIGMTRPSAVLLGADALLAGGPVHAPMSALEFCAEIREQLEDARRGQPEG